MTSTVLSPMPSNVEILERERKYSGWLKVERLLLRFEKFDGSMSEPVVREIVDRGHAVGLLPYDPATGKVLMIRQCLTGAVAAGVPAWPLQVIAGMIDAGEKPAETAAREANEEAGITVSAQNVERGPTYLVSPGAFSETIHIYYVPCDLSGAEGGVHGLIEENEDIRSEIITLDDALAEIENGAVLPSLAVVALLGLKVRLLTAKR